MAQLNWCFSTHCHPFCWIGHIFSLALPLVCSCSLKDYLCYLICHRVWACVCVYVCVCRCRPGHNPLTVATLTPVQSSLPDPKPLNSEPASITLTDCFLNVDKKDYLSASAWVAEQVINTKHFPYCTSSLNVELTPVSVCCQQGAIYPGFIDSTRAWPRPSETRAAPHNTDDH